MKSIKQMTSDVIKIVHEDNHKEKLNTYFAEMYVEIMIDVLKNYYNQQKSETSRR